MMSELSESLKNHFLKQRNSRKPQKSFSRVSELSESPKNHFRGCQNFPEASKNIFEDGGTLRKLQKLFLRFSESSKTVESDAIRARNRIASFPSPIGVEEMTTFAIGTFISMGSKIVALSLNHIRCRIQRAQPIKIV